MSIRALIADDDAAIRQMLQTIVALDDVEVVACASAAEARAALRRQDFDLVITDMWMETPTAGADVVSEAAQAQVRPMIVILTAFPLRANELRDCGRVTVIQKGGGSTALVPRLREIVAGLTKRTA